VIFGRKINNRQAIQRQATPKQATPRQVTIIKEGYTKQGRQCQFRPVKGICLDKVFNMQLDKKRPAHYVRYLRQAMLDLPIQSSCQGIGHAAVNKKVYSFIKYLSVHTW
jgi:hypothetical protein